MCDKRTAEKNKINYRRRKAREVLRVVAREIQEVADAIPQKSTGDAPNRAIEHNDRPSEVTAVDHRESSDTEVPVQEESDRPSEDENILPEQEEIGNDQFESAEEEENIENEGIESAEEEEHAENDGIESAGGQEDSESEEERGERSEYKELREWAIDCNIPHKNLDKLLSIIRRRVSPDLPKSARTFLNTDSCPYRINETENGQFVYFGIENGFQASIIEKLHPEQQIFLQFNIDGLPIFKSGAKQLWPILCKIHCPKSDIYSPFIVAFYCGDSQPADMINYFNDFIEEINQLQRDGIVIRRKIHRVKVKCFICDSPARALLKNVKGHSGFSACERCTVYGERVTKNRGFCTVYPEVDKQRRTNESFRNQDDPNHQNGISPLLHIEPPVDMVTQILLDKMHLLDGGAMKKQLEYWITGDLKFRLGRRSKVELDRRITYLKSQIPCEFQRKPRPTIYLAKWKCTEFRLFLLYIGPIVLKNIVTDELYKHFLLLHVAARILCSENLALKYNSHAKIHLERYVLASRRLYGAHSISLNTHNLIHIADDAKNMGCSLSCISAYPFESLLGKLRKSIRTAHLPLPQVCRRMHEAQLIKMRKPTILSQFEILKTNIDEDRTEYVVRVRCKSFILTDKPPNNIVLLKDSTIVEIDKMIVLTRNPDLVRMEGREWKKSKPLYQYPSSSECVCAWELCNTLLPIVGTFHIDSVQTKIIKLSLSLRPGGVKKVYAMSLLHT